MANGNAWEANTYEQFEFPQETEYGQETENYLTETDELELAAGLLEITNEEELDHFLGDLISRAGKAVGGFVRSPTGQALGGILRGAARQALPVVGGAIGSAFGGSAGGKVGSQLASQAGKIFGLEMEGLSGEDQEFEAARRFVRFAGSAAGRAASASRSGPPGSVAKSAAIGAARKHAPGLLRGQKGRPGAGAAGRGGMRPGVRPGFPPRGGGRGFPTGVRGIPTGAALLPDTGADSGMDSGDADSSADGQGFDQSMSDTSSSGPASARGQWMRRGRQIIIFNC